MNMFRMEIMNIMNEYVQNGNKITGCYKPGILIEPLIEYIIVNIDWQKRNIGSKMKLYEEGKFAKKK